MVGSCRCRDRRAEPDAGTALAAGLHPRTSVGVGLWADMAVAEPTGAAHSPFATSLGQTPASVNPDVPSAGQAVLVCVLGTSAMTTRDWHYAGMPPPPPTRNCARSRPATSASSSQMVCGLERYREADLGLLRERRNKHRASGSPTALLPAAAVSGGAVPVMAIARSFAVSHSTISRLA